jgi:hypothetical protein
MATPKSSDNPRHISWWPELPPNPRLSSPKPPKAVA